jgi:hypothetical protein
LEGARQRAIIERKGLMRQISKKVAGWLDESERGVTAIEYGCSP